MGIPHVPVYEVATWGKLGVVCKPILRNMSITLLLGMPIVSEFR